MNGTSLGSAVCRSARRGGISIGLGWRMAKYQRTKTGGYMSQPRDPVTGKRRTIVAETPAQLEAKLARLRDVRTDMRIGMTPQEAEARIRPVVGTRMTVEECWQRYEAGLDRSLEKGKSVWARRLAPWFAGKTLWELTADVMRAWEAEQRRAGFAMATVGLAYDMLAAAVNLQAPQVIPGLPWGKWRPQRENKDEHFVPKRPAVGDVGSLRMLVDAAAKDDAKVWRRGRYSVNARAVAVMAFCMLRQGEAAGLGWDHVDIDTPLPESGPNSNVIVVEYQAGKGWRKRHTDRPRDTPKDGVRRLIMHPVVVMMLREQREELIQREQYRQDGPVFPAPGGQWLSQGVLVAPRKLKKWAAEAGFPQAERWCAHSLRHSGIMLEVAASGGDVIGVMKRSGHSDLRAIRGYLHSMGGHLPPSRIGANGGRNEMLGFEAKEGGCVGLIGGCDERRSAEEVTAIVRVQKDARLVAEAEREGQRKRKKNASYDSLEEVFRRWDAAGRPGDQPTEISQRARRAYMKGYNRGVRERLPNERCRAMGKQERGRFLGAWSLAVQRLSRVTTPPTTTTDGSEAAQ